MSGVQIFKPVALYLSCKKAELLSVPVQSVLFVISPKFFSFLTTVIKFIAFMIQK